MKKIITLLFVLALSLAVIGCKEDLEKSAAAGAGNKKTADTAKAAAGDSSKSDSMAGKFKDFVGMKLGAEYTVSYQNSMTANGKTQTYTMTQYFAGANKMRMDTKMQGVENRAYMLTDAFYSCSNQQGSWMCIKIDRPEDATQEVDAVEKSPDDYNILYDGTMSIAGATAQCYKITLPTGMMKECFSKEGVPLYMQVKSGDVETEMKATTYKTSVSDSDFTLPAKAQDMNAYVQQQMKNMPNMPEGYEMPEE